jgi:putative membrane protein (TIGR04086 family)
LAILGGFLTEVGLFAVLFASLPFGDQAPLYTIPPACLVITFIFGFWAARRAGSRFVLHGTIVGAVAALIYIVLTIGQTLPWQYVASHFLKIIGGVAGGYAARRQFERMTRTNAGRAAGV